MAYLKYGGPGPRGASGVAVLAGVALGLLVTGFVAGAWYGRMTAPAPPPAGTTPAEPEALPPPAPAEE
jgi:hypothetical protein